MIKAETAAERARRDGTFSKRLPFQIIRKVLENNAARCVCV